MKNLSYHDVVVIADGKRYEMSNDYGLQLTCTRVGGWELWEIGEGAEKRIAGEFDGRPFRIEVAGQVICGEAA